MSKKSDEDFYHENGFVVFTEKFLLKRGFCCQSGCRHCPYGFNKIADPNVPSEYHDPWSSDTDEPEEE